jgi:hypothetical protein
MLQAVDTDSQSKIEFIEEADMINSINAKYVSPAMATYFFSLSLSLFILFLSKFKYIMLGMHQYLI